MVKGIWRRRKGVRGTRLLNDQSVSMRACIHGIPLKSACVLCEDLCSHPSVTRFRTPFTDKIEGK